MAQSKYTILYSTKSYPEAQILSGLLKSEDIPSVVLSKRDSMYVFEAFPGFYEVHVPQERLEESQVILENFEK